MGSPQTLHDFVLTLLYDPAARSAFELDPQGALGAAGLHDITAADVQDVIPLVVDYAPVPGATGTDLGLGDGHPGVLGGDPGEAIRQLQAITQQLPLASQSTSVDVHAATFGAITVDTAGLLPGFAGAVPLPDTTPGTGVVGGLPHDLSGTGDVAGTLDADVLGGDPTGLGIADPTADGLLGTTDIATTALDGTLDQLTHGVGLDGLDHLGGGTGLVPGGLPGVDVLGGGAPVVDVTVEHVDTAVNGVDTVTQDLGVGNVTGPLHQSTDLLDAGGDHLGITGLLH